MLETQDEKILIALSIALSFSVSPIAFANQAACEAKAVSKDGKPLYGAAKAASIKKCEGGA
jgi:hypothetical protein